MSKPKILQLRRHHDDEYWDGVTITALGACLDISLVPRFKTSGMSGDEWRVHARFALSDRSGIFFGRDFQSVNGALKYSPYFVWTEGRGLLKCPDAVLTVLRKDHVLWSGKFPTFADAAIGMAWHLVIAGEESKDWKHLTDRQERELCAQPGCAEAPVCLYRLKMLQEGKSYDTLMPPKYDFQANHIWFCKRHAHRGNCGLEDADENYEVIEGAPSEEADVQSRDVRESAFGGVIDLSGSENEK